MATVICVDGLAGHPQTTFNLLKKKLEQAGHTVVLVDTSGVRSHKDRVRLAREEYSLMVTQEEGSKKQVFLVGQSAGGSAVRLAAEFLWKNNDHLSGVVLLSPAMPRGIVFITRPLLRVVRARLKELIFGRMIFPTEDEFESLVAPLPPDVRSEVIASRQPVSGVEARTLAINPPKLGIYCYPTLHIYGDSDTWIAPSAQRKLGRKLLGMSCTSTHVIKGAGHLTLASDRKAEVIEHVTLWIKKRECKNTPTKEDVANLLGFADYNRFSDEKAPT